MGYNKSEAELKIENQLITQLTSGESQWDIMKNYEVKALFGKISREYLKKITKQLWKGYL
ncbi:MAG: hypothetical protein WA023_00845 [Lactococcus raffinolactis]